MRNRTGVEVELLFLPLEINNLEEEEYVISLFSGVFIGFTYQLL